MSSDTLVITIRNPYKPGVNFTLPMEPSDTVLRMKQKLQQTYPDNPAVDTQRLIFEGRQVQNNSILKDILKFKIEMEAKRRRESFDGEEIEDDPFVFHLAVMSLSRLTSSPGPITPHDVHHTPRPVPRPLATPPSVTSPLPPAPMNPLSRSHTTPASTQQDEGKTPVERDLSSEANVIATAREKRRREANIRAARLESKLRAQNALSLSSPDKEVTPKSMTSDDTTLLATSASTSTEHASMDEKKMLSSPSTTATSATIAAATSPMMSNKTTEKKSVIPSDILAGYDLTSEQIEALEAYYAAELEAERVRIQTPMKSSQPETKTVLPTVSHTPENLAAEPEMNAGANAQQQHGEINLAAEMPQMHMGEEVPPEVIDAVMQAVRDARRRTWLSYFQPRLAFKVALMVMIFGHGEEEEQYYMVCAVALLVYLVQVGLVSDLIQFVRRCFGMPPPPMEMPGADAQAQILAQFTPPPPPLPAPVRGITGATERFIVGFFASLYPSWQPRRAPEDVVEPAPMPLPAAAATAIPGGHAHAD